MSKEVKEPATPELEKMRAVHDQSQAIGEFIEEFLRPNGMEICRFVEKGKNNEPKYVWNEGVSATTIRRLDRRPIGNRTPDVRDELNKQAFENPLFEVWSSHYEPVHERTEKLLAQFFEIDLNKVEEERRALIEYVRQKQTVKEAA
jgi:hypothetical protein